MERLILSDNIKKAAALSIAKLERMQQDLLKKHKENSTESKKFYQELFKQS